MSTTLETKAPAQSFDKNLICTDLKNPTAANLLAAAHEIFGSEWEKMSDEMKVMAQENGVLMAVLKRRNETPKERQATSLRMYGDPCELTIMS